MREASMSPDATTASIACTESATSCVLQRPMIMVLLQGEQQGSLQECAEHVQIAYQRGFREEGDP